MTRIRLSCLRAWSKRILLSASAILTSSHLPAQETEMLPFTLHAEKPMITSVHAQHKEWEGDQLTIAFWNIEYWPGGMYERRLEPPREQSVANQLVAVKTILDRENPDILVTSEMHGLSSAEFLNDHLAHPYWHLAATAYTFENTDEETLAPYEDLGFRRKPARVNAGRRHEHAVFSRLPWTEIHEMEVDAGHDAFQPRGFLVTRFDIGNMPLWIYAVHPNTGDLWREYRESLPKLLVLDMKKRGLSPATDSIVVMGDFNMDWFAGARAHFQPLHDARFTNTLDGLKPTCRITKPTVEGGSTIDYIFVSPLLAEKLEPDHAVIVQDSAGARPDERAGRDPGIASDHRMVLVRFRTEE